MGLVSPPDAAFLLSESRATPMHVAGLQVFELPDGAGPDWLGAQFDQMVARDDVSPLFRKRVRRSFRTGGQWGWEEDDNLDIEYHVRHSALPAPGRVRELLTIASRFHGTLLDRQRPLWEFHLIEGLEGNRFAAYTKVHHAMVDGVSAMRILERSLSTDPDADVAPPWTYRRPQQDTATFTAPNPIDALLEVARGGLGIAALTPNVLRAARQAMEEELAIVPFKAPPTMLNVHITGARRFAAQSWSLERIRTVARKGGVSLNDAVLGMCSGAVRRYLIEHHDLPAESLTAMVPVSLRQDDSAGGNAVGAVLTSLATNVVHPAERLERIHESMRIGKASLADLTPVQRLAISAANMLPSPLVSMLGGGEGFRPPFNLTISNVPGPAEPLYLNGARLQGVYPLSIPYHGQALNITINRYVDNLEFGLIGCRRRVPHLQRLLVHLEDSLAELEDALGLECGPGATSALDFDAKPVSAPGRPRRARPSTKR